MGIDLIYVSTDERNDFLASLEMMDLALTHCGDNPNLWKWVVIALHSAVQGAAVCHLSDTAQLGALSSKSQKVWLEWYNGGMKGAMPKIHLEAPVTLLKKVKAGRSGSSLSFTERVAVTDDQLNDFKLLNDLRINFSHFKPAGWSLEISGMRRIVKSQIKIILDIDAAGWAFRHSSYDERRALSTLLDKILKAPILGKLNE